MKMDNRTNEKSNRGGDMMTNKICAVEGCEEVCETHWVSKDGSWSDWSVIGISKHCSYHWFA